MAAARRSGHQRRSGSPRYAVSVTVLVLKLALTPALIGAATLAGRRWGSAVGGWLVALPLTSGPLAFFLALDHGAPFAASAAAASLAGATAQAAFCLAYGRTGGMAGWPVALLAGSLGFGAAAVAVQPALGLPVVFLLGAVLAALGVSIRLMPRGSGDRAGAPIPRWDLPARMAVGTLIVLVLTTAAPGLGPRVTGLAATFPVITAVLATFAHRLDGPDHGVAVVRGLVAGLFAFAGFFAVVAASIEPLGVAASFGLAIIAALVIQVVSLRTLLAGNRRASVHI